MASAIPASRSGRGSRVRVFAVAWAVLSLMAGLWAVATPIAAAPDEPDHLIKAAAVAHGQLIGSAGGSRVQVPAYVAFTPAQTCYAFKPLVSAKCSPNPSGDTAKTVTSATSAGLYNPVYYLLVGWPSLLFHDDTGVYAMRLVSAILSSLFLALTVMMVSTWRKRMLGLLGVAVAATPMVFFLSGVVNPNALEATANLAAFVGVLSIVLHPNQHLTRERCLIVFVAAALAVNTRGISPLWVAIALLTPFILVSWSRVRQIARLGAVRLTVLGVGLATGAAMLWTTQSNSLGLAALTPVSPAIAPPLGVPAPAAFMAVFSETVEYGKGLVGVFGWLDTPAPSATLDLWCVFVGGPVLAALILLRGRPLALALTLTGSLILLPPITQALYAPIGGIIWQGRYALALFVCVPVGTAALLGARLRKPSTAVALRLVVLVCFGWFSGQLLAFAFTLKRYTVGGIGAPGATWSRVFAHPLWSPPGGIIWLSVAFVIVFGAGALLLGRLALKPSAYDRS